MDPNKPSALPAEMNPLWRWERPWFFAKWLGIFGPVAFVFAVYGGSFRPFGPPSPHAAYCGNCALGDLMGMVVGVPLGVFASAVVGTVVGGILDCIPNHRTR